MEYYIACMLKLKIPSKTIKYNKKEAQAYEFSTINVTRKSLWGVIVFGSNSESKYFKYHWCRLNRVRGYSMANTYKCGK